MQRTFFAVATLLCCAPLSPAHSSGHNPGRRLAQAATLRPGDAKKTRHAPLVTRDNFVGLSFQTGLHATNRGETNIPDLIELRRDSVSVQFSRYTEMGGSSGPGIYIPPPPRESTALSLNQFDEFLRIVNKSRLTALTGNYGQWKAGVKNGGGVTLTMSDSNNNDQDFVIQDFDNTAPPSFFVVTAYLRHLMTQKFPHTVIKW